ncbi:hypothetical protein LCGC14_0911420 [marine sediment metagenome]|uniref:Uncharacterized protein n=1 Tax=marine sediment metagenome TaxID=412755 RepID=A0A0F9NTL6_9ZZZZ
MDITTNIVLGLGYCGPTDCKLWIKYNNKIIDLGVDENDTYDMLSWVEGIMDSRHKEYSKNGIDWIIDFLVNYFGWKVMKLIIEDYYKVNPCDTCYLAES